MPSQKGAGLEIPAIPHYVIRHPVENSKIVKKIFRTFKINRYIRLTIIIVKLNHKLQMIRQCPLSILLSETIHLLLDSEAEISRLFHSTFHQTDLRYRDVILYFTHFYTI